jgi:uncharacterized cupin superfamily protein
MLFNRGSLRVGLLVAALLLLYPMQSWSQDLPQGVTWEVVAVYNVDIPGVDRVELGKFTIEPGATLTMPLEADEFCTVTQGTFTVINHDLGTTTVYATGSRFSQAKGQKVTVSNPGDTLAVQWVYELYGKE